MTKAELILVWIKRRITCKRLDCAFIDRVSHKEVFNYIDCDGKEFLANWNHLWFRVYREDGSL